VKGHQIHLAHEQQPRVFPRWMFYKETDIQSVEALKIKTIKALKIRLSNRHRF
jgi:hypothetical protein